MSAHAPQEVARLWAESLTAGDLEALLVLYEADATLVAQPGFESWAAHSRSTYKWWEKGETPVRRRGSCAATQSSLWRAVNARGCIFAQVGLLSKRYDLWWLI